MVKEAWNIPCEGTRWFKVTQKIKRYKIELLKRSSCKKRNSFERIKWCKNQLEDIKATNADNERQQVQNIKTSESGR